MSGYKRITLYFHEDAMTEEEIATYSLIKSVGKHQTELVTQIINSFLGPENIRDYSDATFEEVAEILKTRAVQIKKERLVSNKGRQSLKQYFDVTEDDLENADSEVQIRHEELSLKAQKRNATVHKHVDDEFEHEKEKKVISEEKDALELPDDLEDIEIPEDEFEEPEGSTLNVDTPLSDDDDVSEEDKENARMAASFFDDGQ